MANWVLVNNIMHTQHLSVQTDYQLFTNITNTQCSSQAMLNLHSTPTTKMKMHKLCKDNERFEKSE